MDAKGILPRANLLPKSGHHTPDKPLSPRSCAALIIKDVLVKRQSLTQATNLRSEHLQLQDIGLCKALCFGVLRHYQSLSAQIDPLLTKAIRNKDKDIYALLLLGAYQLTAMRVPEYAAIDSCVDASKALKKPWASGLINAVLRQFQQLQADTNDSNLPQLLTEQILSEHPAWLYGKIKKAWPQQSLDIFLANNQEPPLCIRVNQQKIQRADFAKQLQTTGVKTLDGEFAKTALYLLDKPQDITALSGFSKGLFSVQDEAPQLCAELLELEPQQRVLDACAAPGGKTCHILEQQDNLQALFAIDQDPQRLQRVEENLQRLNLHATCTAADILDTDNWWDGEPFDRILCDVPCSATGVIRRHPDIKLLRQPDDIKQLAALQLKILQSLWQCLRPNGIMLYATCSILPEENSKLIAQFCAIEKTCEEIKIAGDYGQTCEYGRQLLPQSGAHDGFFYAKLKKMPSS